MRYNSLYKGNETTVYKLINLYNLLYNCNQKELPVSRITKMGRDLLRPPTIGQIIVGTRFIASAWGGVSMRTDAINRVPTYWPEYARWVLCFQQFSTSFAQILRDICRVFLFERHTFQIGQRLAPLLAMSKVARIAADEIFKDATLKFVPGGAVASIDFAAFGDVVAVVGVVLDMHVKGIEEILHQFLHVSPIQRASIEGQRADKLHLHDGAQRIRFITVLLAATVHFQAVIEFGGFAQSIHAQFVAHERAAFADKMGGVVKWHLLF